MLTRLTEFDDKPNEKVPVMAILITINLKYYKA